MSSSNSKGYSIRTYSIVVLFIVAVAVAYIAGQFNQNSTIVNADITEDSKNLLKADVYNFVRDNYVSQSEHHSEMLEVANKFSDLQKRIDGLDTSHSHPEFSSMLSMINSMKTDIANLKASINKNSTPTNTNFRLEVCQDINCVDDDNRFHQGDVLFLKGDQNTNDRQVQYQIRDSDNYLIDDGQFGVVKGNFGWQWSVPNNIADDTYTIIIEIDNDEDEIDFIVS